MIRELMKWKVFLPRLLVAVVTSSTNVDWMRYLMIYEDKTWYCNTRHSYYYEAQLLFSPKT